MGRKRSRKRERRIERQFRERSLALPEPALFAPLSDDDPFASLERRWPHAAVAEATKVCGTCREFVEDAEGGRGTCLHPGSGVLSPWTDTRACPFYQPHRGR